MAAASIGLALATAAGVVYWHASRVLQQSKQQVNSESRIPFVTVRLSRHPGSGQDDIFKPIGSPAVFNDAAIYRGHLYLCGPSGLYEYNSSGTMTAVYHVGQDLPPAPLVGMTVGIPAGSNSRELLIATDGQGLLEFNGHSFKQIRPEGRAYRNLTAVLPLATGRILLGTAKKGLLVYDGKQLSPYQSGFIHLHITALAGHESDLWIGTIAQGVWRWHNGEITRFTATLEGQEETSPARERNRAASSSRAAGPVLPDPQVLCIAVSGGRTFVGTPMGVAEFNRGKFERVLAEGFSARSLLVHGQTLDVGTLSEGVVPVHLRGGPAPPGAIAETMPKSEASLHGQVRRMLDVGGKVDVLAQGGLYSTNGMDAGWSRVTHTGNAVLTSRNISALAVGPRGRLWVGYFDRGLDILQLNTNGGSSPVRSRHVENDHVFCINRIVPDRESGVTAVATANGLVMFNSNGSPRQVIGRSDGLLSSYVSDVILRPGGMDISTAGGITFIDAEGARSVYAFEGLVNNHVYTLGWNSGRLLAGTLGGLSVLGGGRNHAVEANYTTFNSGLKQDWITAIAPVGNGWFVGTYGKGVFRFDKSGNWQPLISTAGRFDVNFNAMLVTPTRVYVGTLARGMYVYNRASGRWTDVTEGLPSLNVTAFAESGGKIYVGTDNGLVQFRESNLAVE